MIYRILIIALIVWCSSIKLHAQQDPLFTQYMFNTLSLNPAYAGHLDQPTANIIHRSQWIDIPGAPRTQSFTMHSPLGNEAVGIGGTILRDKIGPSSQTGIFLDASYRLHLDKSRLSFGLKGGVNFYNADLLSLNPLDGSDQLFQANISSEPLVNFGFGTFWHGENWYVSASLPKLIKNQLIDVNSPIYTGNDERRHLFLGAGVVLPINPYTKIRPSILFKAVDGSPPSLDGNVNFIFYDTFTAGVFYRSADATGFLFQYEMNRTFKIGYAYDYIISDLGSYSGASHELLIGLNFGKSPKGDKSPRYF